MSSFDFCKECGAMWSFRHANTCPYCDLKASQEENKRLKERFVITGCVFHGNAPFPNKNWQEWADRPEMTGVRIEALKETDKCDGNAE